MPLPSKSNMHDHKTAYELMTDPHFLFTILSLSASICVFFYYLFQLLFRTKDWRSEGTYTPPASRKGSKQLLVDPSVKKKDDDVDVDPQAVSSSRRASLNDGGTPKSNGGSPMKLSNAELASEMEKKIRALRLRSELRKELLKEFGVRDAPPAAAQPPAPPALDEEPSEVPPQNPTVAAPSKQSGGGELRRRRGGGTQKEE